MKFVLCAVVVCALSMSAQASLVAPLTYSSPIVYSAPTFGPGFTIGNPHTVAIDGSLIPASTHLYRAPLILQSPLSAEGTYIAKTLGSEHIATLPGHLTSASSINLEQAPGIKTEENKDSIIPTVAVHGSVIPAAFPFGFSPLIVRTPIVVPAEAKYVAKNLGAEHTAPLPGHIISATSLNLEPAPGSK